MESREKALKELITSELANFLLSECSIPDRVIISVHYPESMARLTIDGTQFLNIKGVDKI